MKLNELNPVQLANAKQLDAELVAIGLTNPYLRAGILAVVGKESGFMPIREISWSTTPAARIRQVFGYWFTGISDAQIDVLKKDDRKFFNHVYSNHKGLGNKGGDDGYNFRGWGYNQITGRANTERIGKAIGLDLINNPESLNTPLVCAKSTAYFMRSGIVAAQIQGKCSARYGISTTKEIKDILTGAHVAHWCNAGFGITPETDPTGGWSVVKNSAESYLAICK